MTKRTKLTATNKQPAANNNAPLLTIERAITDGLCPTSLRQVAAANERKGDRRQRVADNLYKIADRMELLGYGREREVA
jgi:hypothetical protein